MDMAFIDLTCVLSRSRRRTASSTAVIRPGLVVGGEEEENKRTNFVEWVLLCVSIIVNGGRRGIPWNA